MYFEYEKAILSTLSQCEIGVSTCVLEQGKYEDFLGKMVAHKTFKS